MIDAKVNHSIFHNREYEDVVGKEVRESSAGVIGWAEANLCPLEPVPTGSCQGAWYGFATCH